MITKETIEQIEDISVEERLHLIEILLNSLKKDIKSIEKKQLQKKNLL